MGERHTSQGMPWGARFGRCVFLALDGDGDLHAAATRVLREVLDANRLPFMDPTALRQGPARARGTRREAAAIAERRQRRSSRPSPHLGGSCFLESSRNREIDKLRNR